MEEHQQYISKFFETEYTASAKYDNVCKIASAIDSCKNSSRKILYTVLTKTKDQKIKSELLCSTVTTYTQYMHGSQNLSSPINTLAAKYVGSNNYPLLKGSGNFGSRYNPEAAAARYTFVSQSDFLTTVINQDDIHIVGNQVFEGEKIEPKFFIPTVPLLLLNSVDAVSFGYRQLIYSRNLKDIVQYILKRLKGVNPRIDLLPYFIGFTGKIEKTGEGSFEIWGKINKVNATTYVIDELPIGYKREQYLAILDDLEDKNIIQGYKDLCDTKKDLFIFEIKTTREFTNNITSERELYEIFKLIKKDTEQYNALDENSNVVMYNSIEEILEYFINIRLKYYDLRKKYLIDKYQYNLNKLYSKYLFIKGVIDGHIKISNVAKHKIVEQLSKIEKIFKDDNGEPYDYLLNIPISSITKEQYEKLKETINKLKNEYKEIKQKEPKQFWIEDLALLKPYMK